MDDLNNWIQKINFKMDELDNRQKYLAGLAELKGKQDSLIKVLNYIVDEQQESGRKTIDSDQVRNMLIELLKDNEKDMHNLLDSYKGLDKIIHISEGKKWDNFK